MAAAKKEYWICQVEAMKTERDAYKMARWTSPRPRGPPPPLRLGDKRIVDPKLRATVLRNTLLRRFSAKDDIPAHSPPRPSKARPSIPWEPLTDLEVERSTIGCASKAPGADGITVPILKACWPVIGCHITQLFQACLDHGTFPETFKLAEVVLIQKPRKDPASVKGWRPIALLSCLGKGLEHLVAWRIAHLAMTRGLVSPQQIGALPGRAATDLVGCVVYDLETARDLGMAATMVTLDVKGAFDGVLHNRLIQRLQEQGWSPTLVQWIGSFLTNRRAQVKYPGGTTMPTLLMCGTPQGSPLSPILFLLYMAEGLMAGNPWRRFRYADDIAVVGFGWNTKQATESAQREAALLYQWASENVI